jgi:transposase
MLHRTRHLFIRQQTAVINAYVKRQKNDATDAEAICEAVTRANMRFVPTKTPEQQSCLMWFKILSHTTSLTLAGWRSCRRLVDRSEQCAEQIARDGLTLRRRR